MKTDAEIQKDVIEELRWVPMLNSAEIGVGVKNGIVTLTGIVDSYSKKTGAERAAKNVDGVNAVAENILVKVPNGGKKTDAEIAEAVLHALKWDSAIPEKKIKIKVEDGWITLNGEVEWEYQKALAKGAIANLVGVQGITNLITVAPKMVLSFSPDMVKSNIIKALHRRASRDADNIKIETIDNRIILSGMVHSWAEREDAINAAWSIPGVFKVENNIEIESEILSY